MTDFDIFNGDADRILSLIQLRLAEPREAELVTGRKRDIALLKKIENGAGKNLTVLDISMHANKEDLVRLLNDGAKIFYADHHHAGDIPANNSLTALIDPSPETCTAMIVDNYLDGAYRAWSVAAAFGDNFPKLAREKAAGLDLPLDQLEELGILVNYNGYGASVEDLHFHPADLYRHLSPYETPMAFLNEGRDVFDRLKEGYADDMRAAKSAKIVNESETGLILALEDSASSRRVSGVYGNELAQKFPHRAHAILTRQDGAFVVSVRAPINRREGADTLCLQFETGGGRAAAAGINKLPVGDVEKFITAFQAQFS